ncbi:MAG: tyrosine decarboxylase MfnA [Methanimicrococcus sp.]|nr:tyrosine decarboxylase MfnA [Methanimicrococcus sp.]
MDEKGLSEEEILAELSFFSESDTNFRKVLSSMCTVPHPIAVMAYHQFIHSNIGDPGLFQGTAEMERKVIEATADFLNHSDSATAVGHLTSGGTESNIEAVFHMKNRFMAFQNQDDQDDSKSSKFSESNKMNLILPKTAHFSFKKVANLLDVELRKADIDSQSRVIPKSAASLIDENTIGLIGIAGNTEFGACDPIEELSEIALKHQLPLHIDAAFGGFVYPFLDSSRACSGAKFGFDLQGVTSVSIDPHKMGLSVIPAGILVFRDESFLDLSLDKIKVKTPYLTSKYQSTLTGTRPGAAVAAAYAVMKHLGKDGYRKNVAYCMDLTDYFQTELEKIGLKPYSEPQINIVTVDIAAGLNKEAAREKTEKIRSQLFEKYGWNVSAAKTIPVLRFVLMPHVTKEDAFGVISDLKKLLDDETSSSSS